MKWRVSSILLHVDAHVSEPFIEEVNDSPLNGLSIFIKNQLIIDLYVDFLKSQVCFLDPHIYVYANARHFPLVEICNKFENWEMWTFQLYSVFQLFYVS